MSLEHKCGKSDTGQQMYTDNSLLKCHLSTNGLRLNPGLWGERMPPDQMIHGTPHNKRLPRDSNIAQNLHPHQQNVVQTFLFAPQWTTWAYKHDAYTAWPIKNEVVCQNELITPPRPQFMDMTVTSDHTNKSRQQWKNIKFRRRHHVLFRAIDRSKKSSSMYQFMQEATDVWLHPNMNW